MKDEKIKSEIMNFIEDKFKVRNKEELNLNRIAIGDFEISSTNETLKVLEQTMDRLIKNHKGFADTLRQKKTFESSGIF